MIRKNSLRFAFLALALTLAIVAASFTQSRVADGYTPPQSGTTLPQFATPALLAAAPVAGLTRGAEAWVTNQGTWIYQPTCPNTCDGQNTCRTAGGLDGGVGCWVRVLGGQPGANGIATWYANSVTGNDSNDCQTSGTACSTFDEVLRRIAEMPIASGNTFVNLSGNFQNFTGVIGGSTNAPNNGFLVVNGTRTYTGTDGGALFSGVVSSYTAWSTTTEGIAFVVAAVDGGPAFDPNAWPSDGGYILEDTDQCNTTGVGCTGIIIGPKMDAGTFATPGGVQAFGYTNEEPAPGHHVRIAQLTPIGTAGAGTVEITSTTFDGVNVWMGFGSQNVVISPHASGSQIFFETSILNGAIGYAGSNVIFDGVSVSQFTVLGGEVGTASSTYYDVINVAEYGYLFLGGGQILVGAGGIQLGAFGDGPAGMRLAAGTLVVEGYAHPCLGVFGGSHALLNSNLVCHNSVGSAQPAIQVEAGGSYAAYNSGVTPVANGTVSTAPWILAGVGTDGGLPLYCDGGSGCAILVKQ